MYVSYRIMVSCAKLKKENCSTYPLFCQWEHAKGCKSLGTQRRSKKTKTDNSSIVKNIKKYNLIDSGTYGCVINPPVFGDKNISQVIVPYNNPKQSDIGKLYKHGLEQFQIELDLLKKVQQIDPDNEFTTEFKGAMIVNKENIRDHDLVDCLTKKNKKTKFYHQIILENGGTRVDKEYSLLYSDFLSKFEVFLKGMVKLQSQNFVHLDIKPANVLISKDKISLIDFGLMTKANELFTSDNKHILRYLEYPFYPPEFYISYTMMKYGKIDDDGLEKIFNQSFVSNNDSLFRKYKTGIDEFLLTFKKIKKQELFKKVFNQDLALKADVFSIAYILVAFNKKIIYTHQSEKEFVDTLYQKCIETNPYTRISMKELYDIVRKENVKNSSVEKFDTAKSRSTSSSVVSVSSLSSQSNGGGKLRRTDCDKVPVKLLRYKRKNNIKF
jgi:serine/threonine protein kinase